jgi:hypothetical protein
LPFQLLLNWVPASSTQTSFKIEESKLKMPHFLARGQRQEEGQTVPKTERGRVKAKKE